MENHQAALLLDLAIVHWLVIGFLCFAYVTFVVYALEGHLVSFLLWPIILMGMPPSIISLHL